MMTADDLMRLIGRYVAACADPLSSEPPGALATELHAQILAEVTRLHAEAAKSERRAIMFGDIISNHCIAMQAAAIDAKMRGPAEGMVWIENTLCGPGLLPDMDEARALPAASTQELAQAWFDAKMAEHEKFRREHPGP